MTEATRATGMLTAVSNAVAQTASRIAPTSQTTSRFARRAETGAGSPLITIRGSIPSWAPAQTATASPALLRLSSGPRLDATSTIPRAAANEYWKLESHIALGFAHSIAISASETPMSGLYRRPSIEPAKQAPAIIVARIAESLKLDRESTASAARQASTNRQRRPRPRTPANANTRLAAEPTSR